MPPIRRYLRISKYSVLECRVYLDNPSDTRWLLDTRNTNNISMLRRIFDTIKPLVLPKLREENERALAKKKSNPVKDVLVEDDFEVAIFLRESGTRHSLLTKQKVFGKQGRIKSNSNKLTGTTDSAGILIESDDEENMTNVPEATEDTEGIEGIEDEGGEKKLRFETSYEGFTIWGWVLCLLVTRRGRGNRPRMGETAAAATSGQALMEEWIGTQIQPALDED
ncbi:hypothetical protein UA08_00097 [Talaromyces atroroseus]|uniref:Uncharacterized protein n=1 Tax=Talaromyces atroroseus TaxID=1441469 RepID=A0A225BCK6_TALAT|nr:hypothetical protein UA08_00097 [Talaromyces atroroseus]OKL64655.1 hypothetical protein UA08_00097 [Talaromyces atroroseus]